MALQTGSKIIDGKAIASQWRQRITEGAEAFQRETGRPAGLAVILMGEDPASATYVRIKEKTSREAGFHSEVHKLPDTVTEDEALALIDRLNQDPNIDGILVQWPFPKQVSGPRVFAAVDPAKDVDGFHPHNIGLLWSGTPALVPCTPLGVMQMLDAIGVDPAGKKAVVLGRSNIVGKPMAALLLQRDATVTICHSRTPDLIEQTRQADILVTAVGRARMVTAEMVKPGAVVIDVGINRVGDKLVGDVDFDSVAPVAGAITPVPGGVGPMTIAMLLHNTLLAARLRRGAQR